MLLRPWILWENLLSPADSALCRTIGNAVYLKEILPDQLKLDIDQAWPLLSPASCLKHHRSHLPVGVDTLIAEEVCRRVADALRENGVTDIHGPRAIQSSGRKAEARADNWLDMIIAKGSKESPYCEGAATLGVRGTETASSSSSYSRKSMPSKRVRDCSDPCPVR